MSGPYGMNPDNMPPHGMPGGPEQGMGGPHQFLPPMPAPWDPSYPQWYSMWYYSQYGHAAPGPDPNQGGQPQPQQGGPQPPQGNPQQPQGAPQPPPPGFDEGGPPPPKKPTRFDLSAPPPPPPEEEPENDEKPTDKKPTWQAAKKGAVIYSTPRPPTPEPPKPPPVLPPPALLPPPPSLQQAPKTMQWWYDGQSWVYALEQPALKAPSTETVLEFDLSGPGEGSEDPAIVDQLLNKMNPSNPWAKPDKPKNNPQRCEVCSILLTCQKTYQTHIDGRPHKKRLAMLTRAKLIEDKKKESKEQIKALTEEEDPLVTLSNGDIHCNLCDCSMNSGQQAQAHVEGTKHTSRMGMRRGGATRGGRGGSNAGNRAGQMHSSTLEPLKDHEALANPKAEDEYERVFAECLENNMEIEEATEMAEAAKQKILGLVAKIAEEAEVVEDDFEDDYDSLEEDESDQWPPAGVTIVKAPKGFKPGIYKCDYCTVTLVDENSLQEHLKTEDHLALLKSIKEARAKARNGKQRGKGPRIYRGRPNTENTGTMKAQRGRRGLISHGEIMPEKLTKSQKKAQPKDLAAIIEEAKAKAKLLASVSSQQAASQPKVPILMNFVKGGVLRE